jgi:hypothetical protein
MGQQKTRHVVSGFFMEKRTKLALLSFDIKKTKARVSGQGFLLTPPPVITEPQRGEVILQGHH